MSTWKLPTRKLPRDGCQVNVVETEVDGDVIPLLLAHDLARAVGKIPWHCRTRRNQQRLT